MMLIGIMEQCISQSSVSPSSAASYSFSPIAYNSNQSSKEAKLLNRTNLGHNSSSLASSNQIYQNQSQADKTGMHNQITIKDLSIFKKFFYDLCKAQTAIIIMVLL